MAVDPLPPLVGNWTQLPGSQTTLLLTNVHCPTAASGEMPVTEAVTCWPSVRPVDGETLMLAACCAAACGALGAAARASASTAIGTSARRTARRTLLLE